MLQRLGQIVRALAQLVEQPRVLDGDHRLRRVALQRRDLPSGEFSRHQPHDAERADGGSATHHRYDCHGPITTGQKVFCSNRKFRRCLTAVGNVQNFFIEERNAAKILARHRDLPTARPSFCADRIRLGKRSSTQFVAVRKGNKNGSVGKDLQSALHDRVKNGLRTGWRSTDQLENFSSRGLLKQRLVAFARDLRGRCVLGGDSLTTHGFSRSACLRRLTTGLPPFHSLRPCRSWYAANMRAKSPARSLPPKRQSA